VTELLPQRALQRAADLDAYLAEHGRPVGPLHGIPISVKEHIGMADLDLNAGYVAWVGTICKEDAHILPILWAAGAVFYVRSTQPQSLMHLETSNNIYGCDHGIIQLSFGGFADGYQRYDESVQYNLDQRRVIRRGGRAGRIPGESFGDWDRHRRVYSVPGRKQW
jgi:hypothetical protein